ncbi:non-ribosomal peptide synthetase [Lacrimispora algidixylanolytica]|uniref:Non-ribosomal peptide synthetase n=1 Tax=Lacrimispora algidixylanolytica TaxID=94868 RepID=A0A419T186_9FIRM|nr:non-ribosomal peptide synthetase [Lacrimispora algidixylanolytica]RKD31340.1 non-ribosomal peptide synthetase [Lacrimispora algidixylanolytica]
MNYIEKYYYKLTHPQKRVWYVDKINSGSSIHNIGGCLFIDKYINFEIMSKTLNIIIKENPELRIRFTVKNGEPVQYIHDFLEEDMEFVDFSNYKNPELEQKIWAEEIFKIHFLLEDSQLYRLKIFKISKIKYGVLLTIHHIIADGWSISLLEQKICEVYNKLIKGESVSFCKNYSYLDFVEDENKYLSSYRFEKNKKFWIEKFIDSPRDFLYKSTNSIEGDRASYSINERMTSGIKKFLVENKCSLNTFFIMIILIYIYKISNKKDIIIGVPVSNRIGKQKQVIGMFTSTMPFRFIVDYELKIGELVGVIKKELGMCFFNQKYPYDLLLKDLNINSAGYDSLFNISVNYYNSQFVNEIDGKSTKIEEYYNGNQSYSLQLVIKEWDNNRITINFDYKICEYSKAEIHTMLVYISNIIQEILANPNIKVKNIEMLSKNEIDYKLFQVNETFTLYPAKTVSELFEEEAIANPNRIALEFNDKLMSYQELNKKSNQLAKYLMINGIKNNSVIGIIASHSMELIIGMLGIMKAGGAYVPIDPNLPAERVNYMLEDSGCHILLTNMELHKETDFVGIITNLSGFKYELYSSSTFIKPDVPLDNLAYIIYTSGSTGKPKGVMIEHRGLTNYIWWAARMYLKDKNEVMPLYSSISFDLTVTSIYTPLISGNRIIVYDSDETEFILYKILRENKISVLKLTPAHLVLLKDSDNSKSRIKRLIVGGDDLKTNVADNIYNSFGKKVEIYNEYGPTETVVGCMIYKYTQETSNNMSVPIGYPIDNVQVYVLNSELSVVPTGMVGELYISGDGVARGYFNSSSLTYEKFIANPFIKGKKMYRTGDAARYLEKGCIIYEGRIDNQVKIRGHRIELGEIEGRLIENEYIQDAAVLYRQDMIKDNVLIAYVVCKKNILDLEIRIWLRKFLPSYMIPSYFVFLDNLPLTANGKIDHNLLPIPQIDNECPNQHFSNTEKMFAIVLKEFLGVNDVNMKDNYYQLGGDSIKAIQISSKLKSLGLDLMVKDILGLDTIEETASRIKYNNSANFIDQNICEGNFNVLPIVKWFFNQKFINESIYNQYLRLNVKNIDIDKMGSIINKLIEHHDGLRVNYNRELGMLYYNNQYLTEKKTLRYLDLSKHSYDDQVNEINKYKLCKFDIENSLLFKFIVFDLGNSTYSLLFVSHHLVIDGISWRIIVSDFNTLLNQVLNGQEFTLPMKTNSLKDWSDQLIHYSKKNYNVEIGYWENILKRTNSYSMHLVDNIEKVKGTSVLSELVDEKTTNGLIKTVNEIYGTDFSDTLLIAMILAINKVTGNEQVILELEKHGRENIIESIDISRTIGWFTNIFPAFFEVNYEEMDCNIKSIKEQIRKIPNNGFDFSILSYEKNEFSYKSDKLIRFNYLGDLDNIIDKNIINFDFGLGMDEKNHVSCLMDIAIMVVNKKIRIDITYNNGLKYEIVRDFCQDYIKIMGLILEESNNKCVKELTPSDFDVANISQEDLDSLFTLGN